MQSFSGAFAFILNEIATAPFGYVNQCVGVFTTFLGA
jgi:hypothetical protein